MRITLTSIPVDDQDKALKFYTKVLGFTKKHDFPAGGAKWLTVTSPDDPDGIELLLEPDSNPMLVINGEPATPLYKKTLKDAGIPFTSFAVDDVNETYKKLKKAGVVFESEPTEIEGTMAAVFDDTCGNLIMIASN